MCDVGTAFSGSNFYANLMASRPLNMPLDLLESVIEQTSQFAPRALLGFAFTEPLIYPHLMEALDYAHRKGLATSLTTNGLVLPKRAAGLVKHRLSLLNLSIDGPAPIHNTIRGNKRSFEKAMEGIEKLLEYPATTRPRISIYCTITDRNFAQLNALAQAVKHLPLTELGFLHTNFTTPEIAKQHNITYGKDLPATESNLAEVDLGAIDLEVLSDQLKGVRSLDLPFPVAISPNLVSLEQLHRFYREPAIPIGRLCNDTFRAVMIKSNGEVIPSHGRCYNVPWGNLHESSLKNIWNSSAAAKFRKTLIINGGLLPACSRCCSAF